MDYICGEQEDQELYPNGTASSRHGIWCISSETTVKPVDLNPSEIIRTVSTSTSSFGKNLYFPLLSHPALLPVDYHLALYTDVKFTLAVLLKCVGNTYTHCEHDLATPRTVSVVSFLTDGGWR